MDELDRMAAALCRTSPNHQIYHYPGDAPRKWFSPGGAIYDTSELGSASADVLRQMAEAARDAQRKEPKE